jgi:5'-deoxynucleotidase YfbR-like HD superfamily hydrolase
MLTQERLRLSHVRRWNIVATLREQTVAEHSFNVWVITRSICDALDVGEEVRKHAEEWALLHDLPEVKLGDIPTPSKRMIDCSSMTKAEREVAGDEWFTLSIDVTESQAGDIVKLADVVEAWVFLKVWGTGRHAQQVKDEMETRVWTTLGSVSNRWGWDLQQWATVKQHIAEIMQSA